LSETDQVAHVPVEVVGGGTSCMSAGRCFSHEGRRMLVEVILEGEPTLALLDTGSTYTTMLRYHGVLAAHAKHRHEVSLAERPSLPSRFSCGCCRRAVIRTSVEPRSRP
jgi:hypothetical protein